jgi:hypothetical protein
MSQNFLPKVHIDALVTAALHWARPEGFPYRRLMTMSMKTLTRANADQVGEMLWRANWDQTEEWADPAERSSRRCRRTCSRSSRARRTRSSS